MEGKVSRTGLVVGLYISSSCLASRRGRAHHMPPLASNLTSGDRLHLFPRDHETCHYLPQICGKGLKLNGVSTFTQGGYSWNGNLRDGYP
jgi:hypothetical protein